MKRGGSATAAAAVLGWQMSKIDREKKFKLTKRNEGE